MPVLYSHQKSTRNICRHCNTHSFDLYNHPLLSRNPSHTSNNSFKIPLHDPNQITTFIMTLLWIYYTDMLIVDTCNLNEILHLFVTHYKRRIYNTILLKVIIIKINEVIFGIILNKRINRIFSGISKNKIREERF